VAFALVVAVAASASAQTVILVRHAERADTTGGGSPMMGADPDLSPAGKARAERLAGMVKDAGIAGIFVTEFKRTQQTAAPLAAARGLTPTVIPSADTATLVARLRAAKTNVLVVGHSNSLPEILKALGISTPIAIADAEYDNLFIVTRATTPQLLRLRF
jgi:broad specificity phosphatase PhoE